MSASGELGAASEGALVTPGSVGPASMGAGLLMTGFGGSSLLSGDMLPNMKKPKAPAKRTRAIKTSAPAAMSGHLGVRAVESMVGGGLSEVSRSRVLSAPWGLEIFASA